MGHVVCLQYEKVFVQLFGSARIVVVVVVVVVRLSGFVCSLVCSLVCYCYYCCCCRCYCHCNLTAGADAVSGFWRLALCGLFWVAGCNGGGEKWVCVECE